MVRKEVGSGGKHSGLLGGRDDVELGVRLSFNAGNPLLARTNSEPLS